MHLVEKMRWKPQIPYWSLEVWGELMQECSTVNMFSLQCSSYWFQQLFTYFSHRTTTNDCRDLRPILNSSCQLCCQHSNLTFRKVSMNLSKFCSVDLFVPCKMMIYITRKCCETINSSVQYHASYLWSLWLCICLAGRE